MIKLTFTCVRCDKEMKFELEVEPYGWLRCPECSYVIQVDISA